MFTIVAPKVAHKQSIQNWQYMNATTGIYANKLLRYVLAAIKSGIVMHDYWPTHCK